MTDYIYLIIPISIKHQVKNTIIFYPFPRSAGAAEIGGASRLACKFGATAEIHPRKFEDMMFC